MRYVFAFVFIVHVGFAQPDSIARKAHYFNTFTSGVQIGCGVCNAGKDFTFSFTTHQGIAFPSGVKLSVGTGLDTYADWRMIPIMLGFTVDRESRANSLFFQFNGGYSVGRYVGFEPSEFARLSRAEGMVFNPMLGFRMGNEKVRLYILAGYKYQQATMHIDYNWGWGPTRLSREADLGRAVVQLGFGFN